MGKLHELLSIEETVTHAAEKLMGETNEKFHKHTEFFTGSVRTLTRLKDSPEDQAIEKAQRRIKEMPTTVPETLEYVFPFLTKMLKTKLEKHCTNQIAIADVELNGVVIMKHVPVDYLLDLEKIIPKWRKTFAAMPTLDPSRKWEQERTGVWKTVEPSRAAQTEKTIYPVILHEATKEHPAQIKESSRDIVVGMFEQVDISGAATSQQKADALTLCDNLIIAVKAARMRANSVDIESLDDVAEVIPGLFADIF